MTNNQELSRYYNLIIGLAGPYGSGCSSLAEEIGKIGNNWPGCHVEHIHVSELIKKYHRILLSDEYSQPNEATPDTRQAQQDAGTKIRKIHRELIGKLIVCEISNKGKELEKKAKIREKRTLIFVVDSLKNVGELNLLKRVYGDEFYFCFVHANKESRWRRMRDYKSWKEGDKKKFQDMDDTDNDEAKFHSDVDDRGQQVGKLAAHADYYIVNNTNREALKSEGHRFLRLLVGEEISQPTNDERCMHLAFSAAISSACLSRQVGAAIFTPEGNILSVGHNDVPRAKGGLYCVECKNDSRCFKVGDRRCINDTNKEERFKNLADEMYKALGLRKEEEHKKILAVVKASEFKEATEYCRAVHAEMTAILSVSRNLSGSTIGAIMYVTTQPCHNCTKHIICSGISKVVYIEPYPKSLGEELHSDAIVLDPQHDSCSPEKVILVQYQGIAPHKYHDFFKMVGERKEENGKLKQVSKLEWASSPRYAKKISKRFRDTKSNEELDPITVAEFVILEDLKNNYLKMGAGDERAQTSKKRDRTRKK